MKTSYFEHFKELRNRIIYCFLTFLILFIIYFYKAEFVGHILTAPLFDILNHNENKRMIFTGLPEVFISYFKISLFAAFISSFPFIILQVSLFISPALYKKEKAIFKPLIFLVPVLFFLGLLFAYFILIPIIWNFFVSFESMSSQEYFAIELESRFSEYMKLTMYLLFASGLAFLFPVLLLLLSKLGLVSIEGLKKNRKYYYIGILIFGAVFTPPDIISQLGIALPLFIFFELSIFFINLSKKKKK